MPSWPEVRGEGRLADALRAALAGSDTEPFRLEVSDAWSRPPAPIDVARIAIHTEPDTIVIGPLEVPGQPGCSECLSRRRSQAHPAPAAFEELARRAALEQQPSAWLASPAVSTVTAVVAEEHARWIAGEECRTAGAILLVDLRDLVVSRHRVLPDPWCAACGALPDDGPTPLTLTPQRKIALDIHRTRMITDDLEQLTDAYVDPVTGIIPAIFRDTRGGLAVAAAPFRVPGTSSQSETGFGCSTSYHTSETVAVLEALERRGGLRPGRTRTIARGSYAQLVDSATAGTAVLDPRTVGLHPAKSYDIPGFRFRRFTEHEECSWVWGTSLTHDRPVLVPEFLAYYRAAPMDDEPPFCYDISNGCALGSSLVEAAVHGLLELVERDAFLLTWYARLSVPRLDLDGETDPRIRLTAAAVAGESGYDVQLFDTTMEHGIPSVWAVALGPEGAWPALVCSAGSGFDLRRAVLGALEELGPIVQGLREQGPADEAKARRMIDDPSLVVTMDDHTTLYSHPGARRRLDFLTTTPVTHPITGRADDDWQHTDLRDDLRALVARLAHHGLEVIVIDQTTSEHRAAGLSCVKVVVPGMLPMTFGHRTRRVDGLPRLRDTPARLQHRTAPLDLADINPHPHPFP